MHYIIENTFNQYCTIFSCFASFAVEVSGSFLLLLLLMFCRIPHIMDRNALKQNQLCGSWEMKERLGMGGFGHVYLYQHLVSSVMFLYIRDNTN